MDAMNDIDQLELDQLDTDQLRQLVHEQHQHLQQHAQVVVQQTQSLEQKESEIKSQVTRIEHLEALLRRMNHQRFGASSEKHPGQAELHLFNEAELIALEEALRPADKDNDAVVAVPAHNRKKKGARRLPEDLPRVEQRYELPERICSCGDTFQLIGYDTSEQLAIIPQQYYVIVHKQCKYSCTCGHGGVITAPKPKAPIPGSQASPQLIAHVMSAKYHDGLPLYRQEKMAMREGLNLPRSKLARWVIEGSKVLQPVWNLLEDTLFSYDITAADETGIQVLKEEDRAPQNKSWLWLRRGGPPDKPVVLVDYSSSRAGRVATQLLEQTQGYLICDAYAGYKPVAKDNGLTLVLCNDHARRKFSDAIKSLGKKEQTKRWMATKALNYYKLLYQVERDGQDLEPQARHQHRQDKAVPIWAALLKWAQEVQHRGVGHKDTREALAYLLNQQVGLQTYLEDGRLPISNIKTEHIAKTIAVARKNFLFADTPAGAKASARAYSLLETAKANGHHPQRYLSILLNELPNAKCVEEIEALLPWQITPDQIAARYALLPSI
jgi:transposase